MHFADCYFNTIGAAQWLQYVDKIQRTGSRFICKKHREDADFDFIILTKVVTQQKWVSLFTGAEWGWRNSKDYPGAKDRFISIKKKIDGNEYNLLITDDMDYYNRFVHATFVAKLYNIEDKELRCQLFTAIIDGAETLL